MNTPLKSAKGLSSLPFLLLLCCLFTLACSSSRQIDYFTAYEQIINLKEEGCLVVRLNEKAAKVEALIEMGMEQKAEKVRMERLKRNQKLMDAFLNNYDFSPVYFTTQKASRNIQKGDFSTPLFYDANLQVDSKIELEQAYIFFVDYGKTVQDTGAYFDQNVFVNAREGKEMRETYNGDEDIPIEGIIIKSIELVQLDAPFPFVSRKGFRSDKGMVKALNRDLRKFYEKTKAYLKRDQVKNSN